MEIFANNVDILVVNVITYKFVCNVKILTIWLMEHVNYNQINKYKVI